MNKAFIARKGFPEAILIEHTHIHTHTLNVKRPKQINLLVC